MTKKPDWDAYFGEYGVKTSDFPRIAGAYKGKNLCIFGDASCVWQDAYTAGFARYVGRGSVERSDFDLMAVNRIGCVLPANITHWYGNLFQDLQHFYKARRGEYDKEFSTQIMFHSNDFNVENCWPWGGWGTSGLGAVLTALALDYEKIIVCGMPLDNSPHNGEPPWRGTNFMHEVSEKSKKHWTHAINTVFGNRVTFVSGRVKDWLLS